MRVDQNDAAGLAITRRTADPGGARVVGVPTIRWRRARPGRICGAAAGDVPRAAAAAAHGAEFFCPVAAAAAVIPTTTTAAAVVEPVNPAALTPAVRTTRAASATTISPSTAMPTLKRRAVCGVVLAAAASRTARELRPAVACASTALTGNSRTATPGTASGSDVFSRTRARAGNH